MSGAGGGSCGMGEPGERFPERRGRWKGARGARRKPEVRAINSGPGASPFPRGWGGRGGWVGGGGYRFKRVSKSLGRRLPSLYLHSQ